MTNPGEQFKSLNSGRFVVPGWTNLVPGKPDAVELQLDLNEADAGREQALLLVEYWADGQELTLQSLLPVRAFRAAGEGGPGWCVFVPAQGRVLVRAVDAQPDPPVLASHWINLDPGTPAGTTVHIDVKFPDAPAAPDAAQS